MTSENSIRATIDTAGSSFRDCWGTLCDMKSGNTQGLFAKRFREFQPTLADAIFRLDEDYRAVTREKRSLVNKKEVLSEPWFGRRMRKLESYRTALKEAGTVGRSIGDAFAWFFYRNDQATLARHLQHEPVSFTPSGIGGKGEVESLKRLWSTGRLPLYHGVTSCLRHGDFSLMDLNSGKAVAIAEAKARRKNKQTIEVRLHLVGKKTEGVPAIVEG